MSSLTNRNAGGGIISQYNYSYDAVGNITAVSGSTNATYTYDNQSQLLTETQNGTTWTYTYDTYGNLRTASDGTTTHTYTYPDAYDETSWQDLLTAYDGNAISYDAIGNPTTWYDGTAFTWVNGRRLASATNTSEGLTAAYTYDADGLRLTKTINGVEHKYLWQGSKLVSEYYDGKELEFFYDESGNPYAFSYKASSTATPVMYYYLTNLQGDITGILDSSGTTVAAYTYNAWGNILSSSGTLADLNPLRYRGYYFDAETGLYYVSSRYYDPEIGRFINPDDVDLLGANGDFTSFNLFAYCGNNPVIREDSRGNFWLVSVGVGLATQYIGDVIGNLIDGKTGADIFKPTSTVGEYIAAGVTALIPGTGLGGAFVRNVISEGIAVIENAILGNEVNVIDSMINVGLGTVLDVGFDKVSDKAADFISSKMPQNYSSYAHTVRQSNPNLTREQICCSMQRTVRFNCVASKAVSTGLDVVRSTLPY